MLEMLAKADDFVNRDLRGPRDNLEFKSVPGQEGEGTPNRPAGSETSIDRATEIHRRKSQN